MGFNHLTQDREKPATQHSHREIRKGRETGLIRSFVTMKDPAEIGSVIVGIFDDSQDLEEANKRLVAAGFEGAVYGAAFRAEESCEVAPMAVGPVLAPGFVPPDGSEERESGLSEIDAFRSHLADCHLRDEVIEAYATSYLSPRQVHGSQNRTRMRQIHRANLARVPCFACGSA